jgi:hypothetical protein
MTEHVRHVTQAAEVLGPAMDSAGGPLGLVGRVVGLGADEIDAGVPGWAWFGIGIVAGAGVMYALHDRIEAFVER